MEEEEISVGWLEQEIKHCNWLSGGSDPVIRVISLSVEDAVPKGFNYSGRLLRLQACVTLRSGTNKHVSLILKSIPLNEDQSTFIAEHGLFLSETKIYDEVLCRMETLLNKNELDWPSHYTVSKESMLLLQDLKDLGYSTVKQREATLQEGLLVVEALGRFHAKSLMLMNQRTVDMNQFKTNHMAESETISQFVYISSLKAIIDSIKSTGNKDWYKTAETVQSNLSKISPGLRQLSQTSFGSYDVLNHGDCWLNNIMFTYSSHNNQPASVKLIDFQLCYYNSLAWDLVHFMYCSFLRGSREKYKKTLIKAYRISMEVTLNQFKDHKPILEAPSEDTIDKLMRELMLFGLLVSLATTPRLVPDISVSLDLDITLPDHAHKVKTAVYSEEPVFGYINEDLKHLCLILENLPRAP